MPLLARLLAAAALTVLQTALAAAETCSTPGAGLGVERLVEIDTSNGPLYGDITRQEKEASFLKPKEVVLTFDDGPMPWITRAVLDTLDEFCTKATFFSVGKMAVAYPATLRDVVARGHTLGAHTWSHPLNLRRLSPEKANDQIERGFAALSLASGGNVAPFFRFPGLSDSPVMLDALQKRGIAAFTVDVVSDDSFIASPSRLANVTLQRVIARNGGILLFHDIKPATAKALPVILARLKEHGFKVVHMRPKAMLQPLPDLVAEVQPLLARKDPPKGEVAQKAALLPFFGSLGPRPADGGGTTDRGYDVETLNPVARLRIGSATGHEADVTPPKRKSRKRRAGSVAQSGAQTGTDSRGWSPNVRRERLSRTLFD